MNKTFSIPQPIIDNPLCEYFAIRNRKILPAVGAWSTVQNIAANSFTLSLDPNSVYEIEAIHHCCDGSDSEPRVITYDTSNNNPLIYVCMQETFISDTCATTGGNCRNCEVLKSYKFKFFKDSNATTPYSTLNGDMKLRVQEVIDGVTQQPYEITVPIGSTEYDLGSIPTYREVCAGGGTTQIIHTRVISILDGSTQQVPYAVISCVSNNPTLVEVSNSTTGVGGVRTQSFKVGSDIISGNKFKLTVYSVVKTVTATVGDTPTSIAQRLASMINSTQSFEWNQYNSAPIGQNGFPPTATSSGSTITLKLNHQNSFFGAASQQ